jgi:hypothetical protein
MCYIDEGGLLYLFGENDKGYFGLPSSAYGRTTMNIVHMKRDYNFK